MIQIHCFFEAKCLQILHQNIAGLLSKSDTLLIHLEELRNKNILVDVLCITEHFMSEGQELFLNFPNYTLAACYSRNTRQRGGACILVKNGHRVRELVEIKKKYTNYRFRVLCYRISRI